MPIDARPFLNLTTASGGTIKCGHPKLKPLSYGLTGHDRSGVDENPTHTIDVYVALAKEIPFDLTDGTKVTVDTEKGKVSEHFRILKHGVEKGPGVWRLYVRRENDGYQEPA